MKTTTEIILHIIKLEGETYTNNPKDSGGPTKYGITQKTLEAYRKKAVSPEDVKNLTKDEAFAIYKKMYYEDTGISLLGVPEIEAEVLDTGINIGPNRASSFLQRALNALNKEGKLYPDLIVDGSIGKATVNALASYLKVRGAEGRYVLLTALNCLQGAYYTELVEKRSKDEEFYYGWMKERVII